MAIGRRGAMFTVMAIVLALFIVSSQEATNPYIVSYEVDTIAAQTRVSIMNSYSETFEHFAEQSLSSSSFFALNNLSAKIGTSDAWITDIQHNLSTCLIENRIDTDGDGVLESTCLPPELNFTTPLSNLSDIALDELAIQTSGLRLYDVRISEERPMEVIVDAKIDYTITDARFATWEFVARPISVVVVVQGMRDPLYERMLAKGYVASVRELRLSDIKLSQMDPSNFTIFYANRSYLYLDGRSPSILQRFSGEHAQTSDCCGVEGIVNLDDIAAPITDAWKNYTLVDHLFFQYAIEGLSPTPDCAHNEIKTQVLTVGSVTHTVTIDAWRHDNTYGLAGGTSAGPCATPGRA